MFEPAKLDTTTVPEGKSTSLKSFIPHHAACYSTGKPSPPFVSLEDSIRGSSRVAALLLLLLSILCVRQGLVFVDEADIGKGRAPVFS